jgi:hypothetical protein
MMCMCTLQPYAKKGLRPQDVIEFAWDEPKGNAERTERKESAEEVRARYAAAKARYGLR